MRVTAGQSRGLAGPDSGSPWGRQDHPRPSARRGPVSGVEPVLPDNRRAAARPSRAGQVGANRRFRPGGDARSRRDGHGPSRIIEIGEQGDTSGVQRFRVDNPGAPARRVAGVGLEPTTTSSVAIRIGRSARLRARVPATRVLYPIELPRLVNEGHRTGDDGSASKLTRRGGFLAEVSPMLDDSEGRRRAEEDALCQRPCHGGFRRQ